MVHLNLSTLIMSNIYANDSTLFWNAVAIILQNNGEHDGKITTNQRLSDITSNILITIYVKKKLNTSRFIYFL